MQIRYLDGEIVDILPNPGGKTYRVVINGEHYCTCEKEDLDTIAYHMKQRKPWIRDNGDGTHTMEWPDDQVAKECAIHNAQNRRAGGWSGD